MAKFKTSVVNLLTLKKSPKKVKRRFKRIKNKTEKF